MPEHQRYHQQILQAQRDRREVEAILLAALVASFAVLWRLIFPKLRDKRHAEIDRAIDEWEDDFEEEYGGAIFLAAGKLAGPDVDAREIADNFSHGTAANVGAGRGPALMISENIRDGVQSEIAKPGATDAEIQRAVKRWMDANRAKVISVTDATNLQSEATKLNMQRHGRGFWAWQTMEDNSVCDECEELNGLTFTINDPMPPKHHNCILPGQEVSTPLLVGASQSIYRGVVVEIRTGSGRVLTVTPHHPIASSRGWIISQDLKIGENLICHSYPGSVDSCQIPNYDNGPTAIENVFHSLEMTGGMVSRIVPTTTEDFHGDGRGIDGNVKVITPDWELRSNLNTSLDQLLRQEFFGRSDIELLDKSCMSTLDFLLAGLFPASHSGMGGPSPHRAISSALLSHHDLIGFGLATDGNSVSDEGIVNTLATDGELYRQVQFKGTGFIESNDLLFRVRRQFSMARIAQINALLDQNHFYGVKIYPELFSDLSNAFPGGVVLDNVINLTLREYAGHVYDLQSDFYGLYTCQGVFVKNCRCEAIELERH